MKEVWLDSNTIIRYLTNNPTDQAALVQRLLKRAENNEVRISLDRLIVAEVIWALQSSIYKMSMSSISKGMIPFLSSTQINVEDRLLMIEAIELSRDKNVDFIDAYLAARVAGRDNEVATFDEADFKKLPARWSLPG